LATGKAVTGLRKKLRAELAALSREGAKMFTAVCKTKDPKDPSTFFLTLTRYESWYTRARRVVAQLVPDRETDFVSLYEPPRKSGAPLDSLTYGIKHAVLGMSGQSSKVGMYSAQAVVVGALLQQIRIVQSASTRLDDTLANIRGTLQAELFDTEVDAAKELARTGHLRAAGAVAGVVLERHLAEVAARHRVGVKKKNPTIADFNEALKTADVIDVPVWRRVQTLYDVRTLCCHKKHREPRADEVADLLDGVDKLTKTLF